MPYGNIGDASNNNHKQLHHSIGLSDLKTVIVYYNLVLLQMHELLWMGKQELDALNDWSQ